MINVSSCRHMVQQNGDSGNNWDKAPMLRAGEERGPSVARVRDHVIRAVELWCGAEPRVRAGHVSVDIVDKVDNVDIVHKVDDVDIVHKVDDVDIVDRVDTADNRYCPVDTCRPRPCGRSWTRETRGPPAEWSHRRSRPRIW